MNFIVAHNMIWVLWTPILQFLGCCNFEFMLILILVQLMYFFLIFCFEIWIFSSNGSILTSGSANIMHSDWQILQPIPHATLALLVQKNSLILQNKNPENLAIQVTLNTYQECGNWVVGYRATISEVKKVRSKENLQTNLGRRSSSCSQVFFKH